MSLFSHWKEEETNEEKFNNITGSTEQGRTESELKKDIERKLSDNYTSRTERNKLLNLSEIINNTH
jgi:hypothetical protein